MADAWTKDLAALGKRTRTGLSSLATTRAALHQQFTETNRELNMRFFKQRPVLATLITLLTLGLFAPLAYAVVDHVWISIDTSKSESDIAADVKDQLEAAGYTPHRVEIEKSQDQIVIRGEFGSDAVQLPENAKIVIDGVTAVLPSASMIRPLKPDLKCDLTDAQKEQLTTVMSSKSVLDVMVDRMKNEIDDAGLEAGLAGALSDGGFRDVVVHAGTHEITVTIKSPPR